MRGTLLGAVRRDRRDCNTKTIRCCDNIIILSVSSVGRNMDSNNAATPKRCPSEDEEDSFKTVVKEQNIS